MSELLPTSLNNIALDSEIVFQNYPTHTYYINPETKRIDGMCDGIVAMAQATVVITSVERYKYEILPDSFGIETVGLFGQDYGYVISDYRRRLLEAISIDDRYIRMSKYDYTPLQNDSVTIWTTLDTVYGEYTTNIVLGVS